MPSQHVKHSKSRLVPAIRGALMGVLSGAGAPRTDPWAASRRSRGDSRHETDRRRHRRHRLVRRHPRRDLRREPAGRRACISPKRGRNGWRKSPRRPAPAPPPPTIASCCRSTRSRRCTSRRRPRPRTTRWRATASRPASTCSSRSRSRWSCRGRRADRARAQERKLKFTIGYSQRFNPKFAYVRKSIRDGTIGRPVSALVSRHITRSLGKKITGRIKLSPAAMEVDARPRLRAVVPGAGQAGARLFAGELRRDAGDHGRARSPDTQWITVTMDSGLSFVSAAAGACRPGIRISRRPGSR